MDTLPEGAVTRNNWGATPPRLYDLDINHPVPNFHLTYTGTAPCYTKEECIKTVKDLQQSEMDAGLIDLKPNFMIGGDGRTYVGRGWVSVPELPERFQDKKGNIYSVAFIGPRGGTPSEADKLALADLIKKGQLPQFEFIVENPIFFEDY